MLSSISEPIDFKAKPAVLAAVLEELELLGERSGGAVPPRVRREALAAYQHSLRERTRFPARWRHDYAALTFDDLRWSSGRTRVPAGVLRAAAVPSDDAAGTGADVPALALENAGGIAHFGSTYLEPEERSGDARVTLLSLADAQRRLPLRVAPIHQQLIAPAADRFTALSTAFQNCGVYVEIPEGAVLDAPLQLLWSSAPGEASAVFPHTVVRVGKNARAKIVERHLGETESFVAGTVEIELGAGARLDYVVVQQADDGARLFVRRTARCAEGSRVGWHLAELGGALTRSVVDVRLAGPRAGAEINAFFFARGFAHADLVTDLDHAASETNSVTVVRGAASGRGHGRFTGGIRIRPEARRCEASMRDDALVLSRDAYVDAVPALEIAASDARAYHAATVGSLSEEELFYVQSRGIARLAAERMIALAFFEPVIVRFPSLALRDEVRTVLDAYLDEVPGTFT